MLFDIIFTVNGKSTLAFRVPDTDLILSHGDCGFPVSYCGYPITVYKASNKPEVPHYFAQYGTACE